MRRRFTIGLMLAALFTLANIGGGVYAGMMGEVRHAGLHLVLAAVGAYVTWLVAVRRRGERSTAEIPAMTGAPSELAARLDNLEQSIDAIAVEVERVGEGQRFVTRLFTQRQERKHDGE
jgi:outer membrane murein-binding lipoprotein Lpp